MRTHWETKKCYWWLDISVWWKSCRFGFWYDRWIGRTELDIYFLFWEIQIVSDKIAKYFKKHSYGE